jgi:hypothetical protein
LEPLFRGLIPDTYVQQGLQALAKRHALFRRLLEHRRMPDRPWDEASIEYVLYELALMDRWVDALPSLAPSSLQHQRLACAPFPSSEQRHRVCLRILSVRPWHPC